MTGRNAGTHVGAIVTLAIVLAWLVPGGATASSPTAPGSAARALDLQAHVSRSTTRGTSAPLAALARRYPAVEVRVPSPAEPRRLPESPLSPETVAAAPPTTASFEGLANTSAVAPPDPNGDVGPNHYVQVTNARNGSAVAVFDKTGTLLSGPASMGSLWAGLGGKCENAGEGDPIAQYDQLADRWVLSQFAFSVKDGVPEGPFFQCVAVSTSPDPLGTYFAYSFEISDQYFADYPKFGVWPDAYYVSVHLVNPRNERYAAQGIIAFDRETMLAGGSPREMVFFANPSVFGLLPADAQGSTPPPVGAPNYLVTVRDGAISGGEDRLDLYKFFVNWDQPSLSRITGPVRLPTDPFDSNMCRGAQNCIPQQGSTQKLDPVAVSSLGDLMMYPLAYRNFGSFEALALNHTVDADHTDHAGIAWYQIANPARKPYIAAQGIYAPDSLHRWMGSISMDQSGDLGLGFSVSGPQTFPSVGYTARVPSDPGGAMGQGEGVMIAGGGAQTATNRWGDYSSMQVDVDGCTFWYTQEYYSESQPVNWHTRIAAFKLDACGGPAASPPPPPPDTRAPRLTNVHDSPDPFKPGAGGKKSRTKISWTVSESSDDKVIITNKRGRVVRRFAGSVDAGSYYVLWRGTTDNGTKAPAGRYTYTITAVDSAGNKSRATDKTTLRR
jgi:FlgD Ig-like domain